MSAKHVALVCNLIGSALSFIAAYYWLRSTKSNLPAIDPHTKKPIGPISMLEINVTLTESAEENKKAAFWTGLATFFLAVGTIVGSCDL